MGQLTDDALRDAAARWRAALDGDGRRALAARRGQIEARVVEADAAIKRAVGMVAGGLVEPTDIVDSLALHRTARDAAKDELALLPVPEPLPDVGEQDIAAFRSSVRAAFEARPVEARRAALRRLLSEVVLSPNIVTVRFAPRFSGRDSYLHHEPSGPPEGSGLINRGWVGCLDVSRPKAKVVQGHLPATADLARRKSS